MALKESPISVREWFEYRGVKYYYTEWTTWNGKSSSSYICQHFSFYPYNIMSFGKVTKEEMESEIDYLLDNLDKITEKKKLEEKATSEWVEESRRLKHSTE